MKTEDVRLVTVNPENGEVFVKLKNGRSVIRVFSLNDALAAQKTFRVGGHAYGVEFVVNRINTTYRKL